MSPDNSTVAVIGAGPVGLAAAAHLITRNIPVKVYEAGDTIASNVRNWGHVRLFSPWAFNIDQAAKAILKRHGWQEPRGDALPTGSDLYEAYLRPLADTPEMRAVIEVSATVHAISREGINKVTTRGRGEARFSLVVQNGSTRVDRASAVIDASGTWKNQNPLGASGLQAIGEAAATNFIEYGIPDVLGPRRATYIRKRILVIGGGHSAANVLLDLAQLRGRDSPIQVTWAIRGTNLVRGIRRRRCRPVACAWQTRKRSQITCRKWAARARHRVCR
jgi:cation diffusion facilitator CzcD-associated flavoprotein CzcO